MVLERSTKLKGNMITREDFEGFKDLSNQPPLCRKPTSSQWIKRLDATLRHIVALAPCLVSGGAYVVAMTFLVKQKPISALAAVAVALVCKKIEQLEGQSKG